MHRAKLLGGWGSPDGVSVALEGVLAPALGPQLDAGVVGARQEVPIGQHKHSLYRPLMPRQLRHLAEVWSGADPDCSTEKG